MRSRYNMLLHLVLLLASSSSSGVQIKSFHDHHAMNFIISAQELTHIIVKGDRIQTVRGNEGTYAINLDENDGTVFIKPTTAYTDQSFSIFISTAQGHTIPLLLTPRQLPSDTLIIQPERGTRKTVVIEKAESTTALLITLIQAMAQHKAYDGFTVSNEKAVVLLKNPALRIERLARYIGPTLQGDVLQIRNRSTQTFSFPFKPLLLPTTKAFAADSLTLLPGDSLCVYRVQSYEK